MIRFAVVATLTFGVPCLPARGGELPAVKDGSCLKGDAVRAIDVAYRDFESFLGRERSMGKIQGEYLIFLANIESYEITSRVLEGSYIVKFSAAPPDGSVVKGAGASYVINKCSFEVEQLRGRLPL